MCCQGIEVQLEAICCEYGQTAGSLRATQCMKHSHRHVEGSRTKFDHRDQYAAGFCRHPQPHLLILVIQVSPQFVQLNMTKNQLLEEMGVYLLGLHPCPSQTGA